MRSRRRSRRRSHKRYISYFSILVLGADMRVRCPKCGYEWEYRGKRVSVTCPNCRYTFRVSGGITRPANTKDDNGVVIFTVPEKDINRINQKELWEKAGAKVVESSKDDRVVVVEIPDEKADEVLKKFGELLEQKGSVETTENGNRMEKSNGSGEKARERRRSEKQE